MAEPKDFKEFPDLTNKLAAPAKKSLFERQRAEAEAKRIREEAETAAVYEDFVKSFDDEGLSTQAGPDSSRGRTGPPLEPRGSAGQPKRHFTSALRNSGPGTLDGPPSISRKRALDGSRPEKDKGIFAFDDSPSSAPLDTAAAFHVSDDEDEKAQDNKAVDRAIPKPTLQLSSLPPGTSPAVIKSLLPTTLVVDSIRIVPPAGPGSSNSTERKSTSAIVTFAKETPASDLDSAVSVLQNKYLGWGYNLSLSRHLSSVALGSMNNSTASLHSSLNSLPFGAQAVPIGPGPTLSRVPPSAVHRGGYAPPSSYDQGLSSRGIPTTVVKVAPPADIRELRLIHKTLENLMKHGPEFEALLMSRPEVQREEKWSWIWNSRSPGGKWYRWRLWGLLTGSDFSLSERGGSKPPQKIFEGGASWVQTDETLPFEFTTKFDQFVSDDDYNSSDEDDSGDEKQDRVRRRYFQGAGGPPPDANVTTVIDEPRYLNPLHKAKLTHLLARLPPTTAKLRKGDVARVTAFAISHAGQGADEVVDMLIANIKQPFSRSVYANLDKTGDETRSVDDIGDGEERQEQKDTAVTDDISGATLIAMHLISDILSASSTSGVRHAWRYRSLFESTLQSSGVFKYLGRMEKVQGWGRLRAEKWRRSVTAVLQLWEGWCVFPGATHARFVEDFNHPPLTDEEKAAESEMKIDKGEIKDVNKSKWKSVAFNAAIDNDEHLSLGISHAKEMVETPEGEKNKESAVTDGIGLTDSDQKLKDATHLPQINLGDKSVSEKDIDTMMKDATPATTSTSMIAGVSLTAIPAKRRRPRAEDMFADSDES